MTIGLTQLTITRRNFLETSAAFAVSHGMQATAHAQLPPRPDGAFVYVGTYTGAAGAAGHGEGIELFLIDLHTGKLHRRAPAVKTPNPSWLALHPSKKYLYAVNEVDDFDGGNGAVSAFAIDGATGDLKALNMVSSKGAIPAHCSVDAAGKFVFVANYGGGSTAVLPVHADGSLGSAVDFHRDLGSVGSKHATDAPPGSVAISGHDTPHAHMIAADPQNRFVLATDLGQDRIYTYSFDHATGKLTAPQHAPFTSLPTGDGPRHFAFHPSGRWLYSIQEEASTIVFFQYDPSAGTLDAQQTISTLPTGFAGTNFASEIIVSPDGKNLYAANRLHDTIAAFSIGTEGRLTHIGEVSTLGDYPRNCCIDPSGNFLFACNQQGDSITSFRIEPGTGLLTFTGQYTPVCSPASIIFLH
ncbi:MAG TPA: lactonase family protein [Terracidiphilus sp.]|nr:lactonase family protein [Terracidiphilus sp.]